MSLWSGWTSQYMSTRLSNHISAKSDLVKVELPTGKPHLAGLSGKGEDLFQIQTISTQ